MKRQKKHKFKYQDPESVKTNADAKKDKLKLKKTKPASLVPDYINQDLKRTLIIIGSFITIVILLYIIQTKTSYAEPILKIFKIVP